MALVTHSQTKGAITFSSGFFAEIINIDWSGVKREVLDCTNMSIAASGASFGNKIFIPSVYIDPGELGIEINFNPDTIPPIGSAAGAFSLALGGDTVQATWAGTGFLYEFAPKMPLDGKVMTATAKLRVTGAVTVTTGS
jgi:hypothetical protein